MLYRTVYKRLNFNYVDSLKQFSQRENQGIALKRLYGKSSECFNPVFAAILTFNCIHKLIGFIQQRIQIGFG